MADRSSALSLHDVLRQRVARVPVTQLLVGANVLIFLAMLANGAGLWHSANGIQLAWGANFGPATQDGQWWRLGTALFLHFGALHLGMNLWALWDGGQLVERMYGHLRFAAIYFFSGIAGNLLSLVSHQGLVVSGGASGAIFGIYGALLLCLWRERQRLHAHEFRWLFWGASGFATFTVLLGMLIPGIDNAAHIGGLIAGALAGVGLARPLVAGNSLSAYPRWLAGGASVLAMLLLVASIPTPTYRWSEEARVRNGVSEFLKGDAAISRSWQEIIDAGRRGGVSFDELAGRIDATVGDHYEESFEHLSRLPPDPALPSATSLARLRRYAELRRDASRALVEGLRNKDAKKMRDALALDKQAAELQWQAVGPEPPRR